MKLGNWISSIYLGHYKHQLQLTRLEPVVNTEPRAPNLLKDEMSNTDLQVVKISINAAPPFSVMVSRNN